MTRRYGAAHLGLIEDCVQSALEQALQVWVRSGVPERPEAWLARVAQNRLVDQLRAATRHAGSPDSEEFACDPAVEPPLKQEIRDDELRMLFVCADESLPPKARLVLCLKLLSGFSTSEIAARLFLSEANVQKVLERGRVKLRKAWSEVGQANWQDLSEEQHAARLSSVQQVIYLQLNEGYASLREDEPVRPELCFEALRLAQLLVSHPVGDRPASWALLALLHFHLARLETRVNSLGELLLLEEQDRSRWDRRHIQLGFQCLQRSATGDEFTRYHGEAAISAEHCLAPSYAETRWQEIVELYELLEQREPSPLYTLNRAIALGEWRGPEAALKLLAQSAPPSWLAGYYLWDAALGEFLRRCGDFTRAVVHLERARSAAPTRAERSIFERRLKDALEGMKE